MKEKDSKGRYKKTHGMSYHPAYESWIGMIKRCNNPKHKNYNQYGGRGITVCKEWQDNIHNFWNDMKSTWQEGLTLDRIDNNKGYSKDNCRWATRQTQRLNQGLRPNNKFGCSGISVEKNGKFRVSIVLSGKRTNLGTFKKLQDAIDARMEAESKIYKGLY